jgi:phytoene dehydrogenase-like protein
MSVLASAGRTSPEGLPRQWDVIVVGAGISSLVYGAQLARLRPELRLLVLDKHYVPGGYASVFYRRRRRFDCSLHKLSGMGEGGNLRAIFDGLGLDRELELVRTLDYFAVAAPGKELTLSNSYGKAQGQLAAAFPHERAALARFFAEVDLHGRNGYHQLQILNGSFEARIEDLRYAHRSLKKVTVAAALRERFADPLLREILAAPAIYVGGFPEEMAYLYFLHVVYATLVCGNAYVRGSSQHLSNTLTRRIEAVGNAVLLKTEVTRVLVDATQRASGVETVHGEFRAGRVVINASPHHALAKLFDGVDGLAETRRTLARLTPSRATTTVYLVTDAPPFELGLEATETMVFSPAHVEAETLRTAAASAPADEALAERAYWEASTMEVTNYHELDPDGGMVVCLNVLDGIDHWPARGTPDYRQKKARAGRLLLERLFEARPGLRGHVRFHEVSTPRTYERYTHNTAGAGYGALVGVDLGGHTFQQAFPVRGVDFLSAWVAGPSYEAAFGYSTMKATMLASLKGELAHAAEA